MTSIDEALSPCPFCGGTLLGRQEGERRTDGLAGEPAKIICADCDARVFAYSLDKAIAVWNRRPSPNGSGEQVSWDDVRAECGTTNLSVFDLLSVVNSILAKRLSASMAGPVPEGWLTVPAELEGPMWVAARKVFETEAERYRLENTTAMAMAIADRAPEKIYAAILVAALRLHPPAPALPEAKPVASPAEGEAVAARKRFKLWFFRDLSDDQRIKLLRLMMPDIPARELETHIAQGAGLDFCLRALAQQAKPQKEKI